MKAVQQIVEALSQREGFGTVVLTDVSGLPLAASKNRESVAALAAVIADVVRAAEGVGDRLKLDVTGEILLLSPDRQRGVLCRRFAAGGRDLLLASFIERQRVDWQAVAQAITQIERVWLL